MKQSISAITAHRAPGGVVGQSYSPLELIAETEREKEKKRRDSGVVAKYSVLAKLHEKYIKQNKKKMVGSRKLELHIKKTLDLLCNVFSLSKNYNYFDKSDIIFSLDDRIKIVHQ